MKRKLKFRGLLIVLAIMLASSSLLAACTPKNNEGSSEAPNSTGTSKPAEGKEDASAATEPPMEIVWLSEDPTEQDDTWVQQFVEKRFNIKIKNIKQANGTFVEQTNLLAANNEMPDLMFGRYDYATLANQGMLAELPVELIKEKMPKYSASVDRMSSALWNQYVINGKNYAIPRYNLDGKKPLVPIYRYDWLKKIGYDHTPATLDELEDVLTKFRNNDPDGNGKKDTYGLTARAKDFIDVSFTMVFGAFNNQPYQWRKDKDGKLVYGMITEETRQGLKVLNRWYENELIDPEFPSVAGEQVWEKWLNNTLGIFDSQSWINLSPEMLKDNQIMQTIPNAELIGGKPVTGPDGTGSNYGFGIKVGGVSMGVQVMKDEKKRDKIFEILEALATDEEVYIATFFGQEGVHYEMIDGVATPIGEWNNMDLRGPKTGAGEFYNMFGRNSEPMLPVYRSKALQEFDQNFMTGVVAMINEVTFAIPAQKDYPDLKRLQDEYFLKFIVGDVDLDKGFDDFAALWKKSGGDAVTASANEEYAKMMQ